MRPLSHTAATIAILLDALAGITVTTPPPAYVNQHNVQAVVGIPGRMYLEILRAPGFPLAVTPVGKLRLVDRQAFIDYVPNCPRWRPWWRRRRSPVPHQRKPDRRRPQPSTKSQHDGV
jgi:hypothetical protein